jgi:hypothetical protein
VLGQVAGDQDKEFVDLKKIRNLPPIRLKIAFDNYDDVKIYQLSDGTPECRFATPWILTELGCFRINFTIVGPKPKDIKEALPFPGSAAKVISEQVTKVIEMLEKELWREIATGL